MKSKRHGESFAEMLDGVAAPAPRRYTLPDPVRPIGSREWVDDDGRPWHMRGQTLGHKEARRLLRRDDLRIVYMLDPWRPVPSELTGSDRDVIAVRIEDFFTEQALAGGFLTLAEFRDESGAVILMVEEDDTGD